MYRSTLTRACDLSYWNVSPNDIYNDQIYYTLNIYSILWSEAHFIGHFMVFQFSYY